MFNAAGGGYDAAFWELPYNKILGCNIVLDCLDDMTGEESLRENLRGEAFVLRSLYYLMMVNMYGMPYNEGDPARNPGVPLKLTMDVRDERFPRNTVAEVYGRIEKDLLTGNRLLTENDYKRNFLRIGHLAAKALLSRVYLYMEDWDRAIAYADSVLHEYKRSGFSLASFFENIKKDSVMTLREFFVIMKKMFKHQKLD